MAAPTLPIRTERLLLRPFGDADLDAFFDMYRRDEVARYLPWEPRTREQVVEMLERVKTFTSFEVEGQRIRLAVVLPESGAVIGDIGLNGANREHGEGEIGFIIQPQHQRQGFATEASIAVLRMGFEELGLHRIIARGDPRNAGSVGVMERLGMRREAHFVRNELIKGEWSDQVLYAILEDEWRART
jgi:RimJ/RimL family protein N-acetyltransferase